MSVYKSIVVLLKLKTLNKIKNWVAVNFLKLPEANMEQFLEASALKPRLCHRPLIKTQFKNQSSLETTQIRCTVE